MGYQHYKENKDCSLSVAQASNAWYSYKMKFVTTLILSHIDYCSFHGRAEFDDDRWIWPRAEQDTKCVS